MAFNETNNSNNRTAKRYPTLHKTVRGGWVLRTPLVDDWLSHESPAAAARTPQSL